MSDLTLTLCSQLLNAWEPCHIGIVNAFADKPNITTPINVKNFLMIYVVLCYFFMLREGFSQISLLYN